MTQQREEALLALSSSLPSLSSFLPSPAEPHGSLCSWPDCTCQLGVFKFYCKRCNGSYCSDHAGHPAMRIKLDERGEWQPKTGIWQRVCERCFTNRHGYDHAEISVNDHTDDFVRIRSEYVRGRKAFRETLRERWQRLESYDTGDWQRWQRMVVEWQPDCSSCSKCGDSFGPFIHRHHCRLCGRVVCGECSELVKLSLIQKEVRVCGECRFHLQDQPTEARAPWPWLEELESIKRQMNQMMPVYWQRLKDLESNGGDLEDAHLLRETLLLQLRNLQSHLARLEGSDDRLQRAVSVANQKWAHERQCWLLVKPRVRPPAPTQPVDIPPASGLASRTASSLLQHLFPSQKEDESSLPLPANFATLMAQLEVLQEQRTNLNEQLNQAIRQRLWDQVTGLQAAMEEIDHEIDRLKLIICK